MSALSEARNAMRQCVFSGDRAYRYTLWREWSVQEISLTVSHDIDPKPLEYVQFIGLNPSIADEKIDDNTITRCIDFAKRWGFGSICMTNLFAWRDTDPRAMKRAVAPIGPENDYWLELIAKDAGLIVCCWGNHGSHADRSRKFLSHAPWTDRLKIGQLQCFGLSRSREPKHPLMLGKLSALHPLRDLLAYAKV